MGAFDVETQSLHGRVTTVGSAGGHTLIVDRPAGAGGGGLGFNGGELLHLAVAGCVSNDLFREAQAKGISLTSVRIVARGEFSGNPAVSGGIEYDVEIRGRATGAQLEELVREVDAIAEIPNSLRRGTAVRLGSVRASQE